MLTLHKCDLIPRPYLTLDFVEVLINMETAMQVEARESPLHLMRTNIDATVQLAIQLRSSARGYFSFLLQTKESDF